MFRILCVLCAISWSQSAWADASVSEKIKYYSVSGKTVDAIKANMKKKGPKGYWAYTEWYVKWTGSCKVSVSVTYTMPKLKSGAPADVKSKFDKMYKKLLKHEKNHGNNGISAAKEIAKKKCNGGDAILAKYNKKDIAYDKKTDHGYSEGVKF